MLALFASFICILHRFTSLFGFARLHQIGFIGALMTSVRFSISCPRHINVLLDSIAELQGRPKSKVLVDMLEASYPVLSQTNQLLLRLRSEQARADQSLPSGIDSIMTEFRDSLRDLVGEVQTELDLPLTPISNTGVTKHKSIRPTGGKDAL